MDTNQFEALLNAIDQDGSKTKRKFWKPQSKEEGTWTIRLLGPNSSKKESLPFFRHQIHYINGKSYECIEQTLTDENGEVHKSETCPFCRMKDKLYKKGEKGSEEWALARDLKAKETYDYRAILRNEKEDSFEVVIARIPNGIHDEILEKLRKRKYGNIFDAQEGRDITLEKKGTGLTTKYSMDLEDPSPFLTKKTDIEIFKKAFNELDYNNLISFPTLEECNEALKDFLGEGDEDVFIPKKKQVKNPWGEETDNIEVEEKEEEEIYTPPKTKTEKKKVTKKEEEIEDEDDEETDDLDSVFGF
jgi:hypothetical protein